VFERCPGYRAKHGNESQDRWNEGNHDEHEQHDGQNIDWLIPQAGTAVRGVIGRPTDRLLAVATGDDDGWSHRNTLESLDLRLPVRPKDVRRLRSRRFAGEPARVPRTPCSL
jgi:hypothetical protein